MNDEGDQLECLEFWPFHLGDFIKIVKTLNIGHVEFNWKEL